MTLFSNHVSISMHNSELCDVCDGEFFRLLDSVTIARSRKHIEKYYDAAKVSKFSKRLKPVSLRSNLTDLAGVMNYGQINEALTRLTLCIYTPSQYIFPSRAGKYQGMMHNKGANLTQQGRENGMRRLMAINLLKRLESSVHSFALSLHRIKEYITSTIKTIDRYEVHGGASELCDVCQVCDDDLDMEDSNTDFDMNVDSFESFADNQAVGVYTTWQIPKLR